ncbi:hypothetical protein [Pseudorhodobacter sp. MZDSW-24AT]|uniref:hypothetical protein n=1 Tax=Pseudorhodobacter sp. MZDSW-24AT TaxID=2052957 RepID=UPI0012FE2901|nr:hypothetical protein [Pseudorhodobacter sp. MZDSW-24AT]
MFYSIGEKGSGRRMCRIRLELRALWDCSISWALLQQSHGEQVVAAEGLFGGDCHRAWLIAVKAMVGDRFGLVEDETGDYAPRVCVV